MIYSVIYAGAFLAILFGNRNPSKSLAYILLLLFLPVVGLVVFYFFGRDFRKKKRFQLKGKQDKKNLDKYWEAHEDRASKELEALNNNYKGLSQLPEPVAVAMEVAASSGIDVELMVPARADSWIAHHASMSYLKPLL